MCPFSNYLINFPVHLKVSPNGVANFAHSRTVSGAKHEKIGGASSGVEMGVWRATRGVTESLSETSSLEVCDNLTLSRIGGS
jgi:hypothetical protein